MHLDFEELMAEVLGLTDDQLEDSSSLADTLEDIFGINIDMAYKFTKALLLHTPIVQAGLTGKQYHAFVSKSGPVMLMKQEANPNKAE